MAKRYVSFRELVPGYFKPVNTLGAHHAQVVLQGEKKLVIGSKSGTVALKEGDTLGYDCGAVWLVPKPEAYKDPIRRVLAEAHISQKVLSYSDDPVRYTASWEDTTNWPRNSAADPSTGESAYVHGSHEEVLLELSQTSATSIIKGGLVIIIMQVCKFETAIFRPRKIKSITVRKDADRKEVEEYLRKRFLRKVSDLGE